ncbi:hypothetical protein QVD17_32897 [Tagetes erecta]|uniref:Uncharacterized protein n=1 Tax=Tagetes erecta TaxID=13708 RepID=A0AAD8NDP2_TARER|nr:hypothetical protein QVD17_32897 [Tagetes erecta]
MNVVRFTYKELVQATNGLKDELGIAVFGIMCKVHSYTDLESDNRKDPRKGHSLAWNFHIEYFLPCMRIRDSLYGAKFKQNFEEFSNQGVELFVTTKDFMYMG